MSHNIQKLGDCDQELNVLADRERKIKDRWLSFKKMLRADKSLDPDYADQKFVEEEAKYEEAMKLIDQQREKIVVNSAAR